MTDSTSQIPTPVYESVIVALRAVVDAKNQYEFIAAQKLAKGAIAELVEASWRVRPGE